MHPEQRWDSTFWEGLLLVISHVALFPALYLLVRRRRWDTAANFLGVFVASTLYHTCRAGFLCAFRFEQTKMADYFFVYRALIWAATYACCTPPMFPQPEYRRKVRLALHNLLMLPFVLALLADYHSVWMKIVGAGVPFGLAVLVSLSQWRQPFRRGGWGAIMLALAFSGSVFGFLVPETVYNWCHTVWHFLSMLSMAAFVLAT